MGKLQYTMACSNNDYFKYFFIVFAIFSILMMGINIQHSVEGTFTWLGIGGLSTVGYFATRNKTEVGQDRQTRRLAVGSQPSAAGATNPRRLSDVLRDIGSVEVRASAW